MGTILLVIQVILAGSLIVFVLMQRSDSDGFGLGSSGGTGLMSGRAKANFMTRTTGILAAAFMANSLLLALVTARETSSSLVDQIGQEEVISAEDAEPTSAPLAGQGSDKTPVEAAPTAAPTPETSAPVTPVTDLDADVEKVLGEVMEDAKKKADDVRKAVEAEAEAAK